MNLDQNDGRAVARKEKSLLTSIGLISTNPAVKNVQKYQGNAAPGTQSKYGTSAFSLTPSKVLPSCSLNLALRPVKRTWPRERVIRSPVRIRVAIGKGWRKGRKEY
jgi:hypothetical protein